LSTPSYYKRGTGEDLLLSKVLRTGYRFREPGNRKEACMYTKSCYLDGLTREISLSPQCFGRERGYLYIQNFNDVSVIYIL
jgi:hypothetical protein